MSIKVFTKVGLMKNEKWIKGTIVEEYDNIFVIETHGNKISVDKHLVKPVIKLQKDETGKYPDIENFINQNWDVLKNNILEAKNLFFPNVFVSFNEEEKVVECEEYSLYLSAVVNEVETLGSFKETPAWELTSFESIPATRQEPEDVYEKVLSVNMNSISAAKSFVDHIWQIKSQAYWENKYFG